MATNIVVTIIVASMIMIISSVIATLIVMPFKGSLIRLRANYNPRAVGFDGTDNTVGPRLTSLIGTMKRTYRLEGWYGLYKGEHGALSAADGRRFPHARVHDGRVRPRGHLCWRERRSGS